MPLSQQLTDRKNEDEEPVCFVEALSSQPLGFIVFFDGPRSRHGFSLAQLLHFRIALRDALAGDGSDAAPHVLTLAFSTADITITGWRLERLATLLQEGRLAAVKVIPVRHVALTGNRPAVASIEIKPIEGDK